MRGRPPSRSARARARRGGSWNPRWLALAPAVLACNTLVGNAEEIDYVPVVSDGGPSDVGREGTTEVDAMAGEDGGLAGDGGHGCDSVFCATFDPPLDQSPWGWSNGFVAGAATLKTTPGGFTSAPFALSAKAPGGAAATRLLAHDLVGGSSFTFEFDLRLAVVPSVAAPAEVVRFLCSGQNTLSVRVSPQDIGLQWVGLGVNETSPPIALPVAEWRHVGVSIAQGGASLSLDGGAPSKSFHDCSGATRVYLGVGTDIPAGQGAYEVWFDGVRSTR